jgi:uncharacterized protein DUF6687
MRFEFYHAGLDNVPKLSVDGTVGNSVHFSHWEGNQTSAEVKADTSTEIALNLVASPNKQGLTRGIELVTNNHFDSDGVLSVWVMLNGDRALDLRDKLIPAAESGDFSEYTNEQAIRASIVIQGSDQASANDEAGSPLARQLAGEVVDDGRAYELMLPEVERVLTHTDEYEPLWRRAWAGIVTAVESFERGASQVEEFADAKISLITLAPGAFSPSGFNPTRHAAPYTAISRYARGRLYLITTPVRDGWVYRIDYPYYSWAETVVRPRIERHDFTSLVDELNKVEKNDWGRWKLDTSELASAVKFAAEDGTLGTSRLAPEEVAKILRRELISKSLTVVGV